MAQETAALYCAGGCKKEMLNAAKAESAGWIFLQITGRYRCGKCQYELESASKMRGLPSAYELDPLPKDSIGSLKELKTNAR